MKVRGAAWVIYIESDETIVGFDVVDNGNGTQTVTVHWSVIFDDTYLVRIGYNDGSWHDTAVGTSSPQSITMPTGAYTYRLVISHGLITTTYSPLPVTGNVWTPYVCSRSGSLEINTGFIDTSVTDSGLWKTGKPTDHAWTLNMEGVVSLNEFGSLDLRMLQEKQIAMELLHVRVERTDEAGNVYANEGYAYISNSSDTGAYDGVATFSIGFRGEGELIQTGSNVS